MMTRAVRDGDDWVINGRKIWITRAGEADFTILMAMTDEAARVAAFRPSSSTRVHLVSTSRAEFRCSADESLRGRAGRLPRSRGEFLGKDGAGFGPMQIRLDLRRVEMARLVHRHGPARTRHDAGVCAAARNLRRTLADRQAIQWWIADAATKIHAAALWPMTAPEDRRRPDVRSESR